MSDLQLTNEVNQQFLRRTPVKLRQFSRLLNDMLTQDIEPLRVKALLSQVNKTRESCNTQGFDSTAKLLNQLHSQLSLSEDSLKTQKPLLKRLSEKLQQHASKLELGGATKKTDLPRAEQASATVEQASATIEQASATIEKKPAAIEKSGDATETVEQSDSATPEEPIEPAEQIEDQLTQTEQTTDIDANDIQQEAVESDESTAQSDEESTQDVSAPDVSALDEMSLDDFELASDEDISQQIDLDEELVADEVWPADESLLTDKEQSAKETTALLPAEQVIDEFTLDSVDEEVADIGEAETPGAEALDESINKNNVGDDNETVAISDEEERDDEDYYAAIGSQIDRDRDTDEDARVDADIDSAVKELDDADAAFDLSANAAIDQAIEKHFGDAPSDQISSQESSTDAELESDTESDAELDADSDSGSEEPESEFTLDSDSDITALTGENERQETGPETHVADDNESESESESEPELEVDATIELNEPVSAKGSLEDDSIDHTLQELGIYLDRGVIIFVSQQGERYRVLSRQFESLGLDILHCKTVIEARQQAIDHPGSIIVAPLKFAEENTQLQDADIETIRIPLIYTADEDDQADRLKAIRNGGTGYLIEPISVSALLELIERQYDIHADSPYRVLVMEDSKAQAKFYDKALNKGHFDTRLVIDPNVFLEALRGFDPEVILMDMQMPTCSGIELTRIVRQMPRYAHVPIIFLSAEESARKQNQALLSGGTAFIVKPANKEQLLFLVDLYGRRYRGLNPQIDVNPDTGLSFCPQFKQRIIIEASRITRNNCDAALAVIQLDQTEDLIAQANFSLINVATQQLSLLLKQRLRKTDIMGHLETGQLGVILTTGQQQDWISIMDNIRRYFAELPFHLQHEDKKLSVSIGISLLSNNNQAHLWFENAAEQLNIALTNGGDQTMPRDSLSS